MTLRLSSACSNQLSYRPKILFHKILTEFLPCKNSGGKGIRTPDIQLAKLALYQLSYAPCLETGLGGEGFERVRFDLQDTLWQKAEKCVLPVGFEPQGLSALWIWSAGADSDSPFFRLAEGQALLLRKEVIQPQVPLRLPCYDFIPVTAHSVGRCLLAVGARTSATNDFHDVTGGVYKARERIHGTKC
jgi:hypothetical protein